MPAWYPTAEKPCWALFIREHAKAVSLYNDVIVLFNEGCGRDIKGLWQITSDKVENGIRTIRIKHRHSPIPKMTNLFYLWSFYRAFSKLIRGGWKPDIIHAHVFIAGLAGIMLGKIYRIPVTISEHSTHLS